MIIYRSCIATSHGPAKYLWSPEKCVFRSLPILITELAPSTHPWITRPLPFRMWSGGKRQRPPFPQPPRPTTHLNATLILAFAPAPQVSPATQAACHHTGMCRAPPPSRPTITRSPRVWMDTAPLPCPIWAAPLPSSTAQLPTRPTPVSKDVCPVFLHVFCSKTWAVCSVASLCRSARSEGPALPGVDPGDGTQGSTVSSRNLCPPCSSFSPVSLAELACNQSSNVRSLWDPELPSSQMELGLTLPPVTGWWPWAGSSPL